MSTDQNGKLRESSPPLRMPEIIGGKDEPEHRKKPREIEWEGCAVLALLSEPVPEEDERARHAKQLESVGGHDVVGRVDTSGTPDNEQKAQQKNPRDKP